MARIIKISSMKLSLGAKNMIGQISGKTVLKLNERYITKNLI